MLIRMITYKNKEYWETPEFPRNELKDEEINESENMDEDISFFLSYNACIIL